MRNDHLLFLYGINRLYLSQLKYLSGFLPHYFVISDENTEKNSRDINKLGESLRVKSIRSARKETRKQPFRRSSKYQKKNKHIKTYPRHWRLLCNRCRNSVLCLVWLFWWALISRKNTLSSVQRRKNMFSCLNLIFISISGRKYRIKSLLCVWKVTTRGTE